MMTLTGVATAEETSQEFQKLGLVRVDDLYWEAPLYFGETAVMWRGNVPLINGTIPGAWSRTRGECGTYAVTGQGDDNAGLVVVIDLFGGSWVTSKYAKNFKEVVEALSRLGYGGGYEIQAKPNGSALEVLAYEAMYIQTRRILERLQDPSCGLRS